MGLIDELITWQEKKLSPYCLKECQDSCCNDEITVHSDSLHLFPEAKPYKLRYKVGPPCPRWDPETHICEIHKRPKRMTWCQDIPLILQIIPSDEKEEIVLTLDSHCELAFKPNNHSLKTPLEEIAKRHRINILLNPCNYKSIRKYYEPTEENLHLAEQIKNGTVQFSAY